MSDAIRAHWDSLPKRMRARIQDKAMTNLRVGLCGLPLDVRKMLVEHLLGEIEQEEQG